jgi:hypothetical protein
MTPMTPRQRAVEIVKSSIGAGGEVLVERIATAIQAASNEALEKGRTFEKCKLVRDIVVTSPNGEHSVKSTQVVFAEVAFPPEAEPEPRVYVALGDWRLVI